jgi:arylsulfatase A-like enzyme
MRRCAALFVLASLAAAFAPGPARGAAAPNILIIVTDDQRDGLHVMPDTLRWFDQGGTSFSNAYATTPTCCPSRASIITGRYSHNHRVTNEGRATVLDENTTISYYLDKAGYHTALFGKYLNSWPIDRPPAHWDEFAYFKNSTADTYVGKGWNIDGTIGNTGSYATDYIGARAVSVIRNVASPWLLYLSTPNPHGPWTTEPEYSKAAVGPWDGNPAVFEEDLSDKPPYVQQSSTSFTAGSRQRKKQLRTLYSVDDMVQRVFSALQDAGQLDNTLAIFVSDNGYLWGEHRRCCKSVPYTQSIQVPMFARWSGQFAAGATDRRLVATIDILPTVLDAAGVTATTAPVDGRSLRAGGRRTRLLAEFFESRSVAPPWSSTVTASYQYVEYNDGSGFREYYDLAQDPWQLRNLLGDGDGSNDPANIGELSSQLASDKQCSGSSCP